MTITRATIYLFKTICFILAVASISLLIERWFENSDKSSISFKGFIDSPDDRYPTFSICLCSTGNGALYSYFAEQLMYEYHITYAEYELLLREEEGGNSVRNMDFRNISKINFKNYTLNLLDAVHSIEFKTNDVNNSFYYNGYDNNITDENDSKWPFFIGYIDPMTICFTKNSTFAPNKKQIREFILLNKTRLQEWNEYLYFKIFIHHPGQLTRVLDKPIFDTILNVIYKENNHLKFLISQVTILRKRYNAKRPCDPDLENDDLKIKQEITQRAECIPNYWIDVMPSEYPLRNCSISFEMANIYDDLNNMERLFKTYNPPCNEMKALTSLQRQPYGFSG